MELTWSGWRFPSPATVWRSLGATTDRHHRDPSTDIGARGNGPPVRRYAHCWRGQQSRANGHELSLSLPFGFSGKRKGSYPNHPVRNSTVHPVPSNMALPVHRRLGRPVLNMQARRVHRIAVLPVHRMRRLPDLRSMGLPDRHTLDLLARCKPRPRGLSNRDRLDRRSPDSRKHPAQRVDARKRRSPSGVRGRCSRAKLRMTAFAGLAL